MPARADSAESKAESTSVRHAQQTLWREVGEPHRRHRLSALQPRDARVAHFFAYSLERAPEVRVDRWVVLETWIEDRFHFVAPSKGCLELQLAIRSCHRVDSRVPVDGLRSGESARVFTSATI